MVKGINLNEEEIKLNEIKDEEAVEVEDTEEVSQAKSFISGVLSYITNPDYDKKLVEEAQRSGLDKRVIANSFATKILGKVSDILYVAVDTVADAFSTLVSILAGLLIKGGELICRVAKRLVKILTLNYTCTE